MRTLSSTSPFYHFAPKVLCDVAIGTIKTTGITTFGYVFMVGITTKFSD
jgi:hypothetical protein